MAKRTVRVSLYPNIIDKFMDLAKAVVARHELEGASSPLNNAATIDMAAFKAKMLQADALRQESIAHRAHAEAKMMEAKAIMGLSAGQTISTERTLYHEMNRIKRFLMVRFASDEKSLCEFGFDVILGTARFIGRPKKKKD
jgi:hypothetical protein